MDSVRERGGQTVWLYGSCQWLKQIPGKTDRVNHAPPKVATAPQYKWAQCRIDTSSARCMRQRLGTWRQNVWKTHHQPQQAPGCVSSAERSEPFSSVFSHKNGTIDSFLPPELVEGEDSTCFQVFLMNMLRRLPPQEPAKLPLDDQ